MKKAIGRKIPKAFSVKIESGLPFHVTGRGLFANIKFMKVHAILLKIMDVIRKSLNEPVTFAGTKNSSSGFYERFIFEQGGFAEIRIGNKPGVYAYFNTKEKAKKFKKSFLKELREVNYKLGIVQHDVRIVK